MAENVNGSLRLAAAVLGLVIVTAIASTVHASPNARPKWVGLSTTTADSSAALVLLRRGRAPTLGLCARYRHSPRLPIGAKEVVRSRGGDFELRHHGAFIQLCVRAPAHESLTVAWLFTSKSPRAEIPVAPSVASELHARMYRAAAPASKTHAPYAIAVVGDMDVDEVAKSLRSIASAEPTAQRAPPGPAYRPAWGGHVVGWKAPRRGSPERAALELATTWLAEALSKLPGVQARPGSESRSVFLRIRGSEPKALRLALKRELATLARLVPAEVRRAAANSERRIRQQLDHHVGLASALLDGIEGEKRPRRVLQHLQLVSTVEASSLSRIATGALALEGSTWLSGGAS